MGTYGYATVQIGGDLYANANDHPLIDILKEYDEEKDYSQKTWSSYVKKFLDEIKDLENNDNPLPPDVSLQTLHEYADEMQEPLYGYNISAREFRFEHLQDICRYLGLHIDEYSPMPYGSEGATIFSSSMEHGDVEMPASDEDPVISYDTLFTLVREKLTEQKDIDGFISALKEEFGDGALDVPNFKVYI